MWLKCCIIVILRLLTEATSTPWLCAMCPRMEKVTVPASKHVPVFTRQVITVSLGEIGLSQIVKVKVKL